MRLSKSTRYALFAALELSAPAETPVTVAGTAKRHGLPPGALAKVFQRLVRSGLAVGTRGIGGGYRLARPPSEVTVLEVVSAFETATHDGECLLGAENGTGRSDGPACRLRSLFEEVHEAVRSTLGSVTLETLARTPSLVDASPATRPARRRR